MSEDPVNAERSRHIDTRIYFLRDMGRDKLLKLRKCAGTQNVADALTKSLCPLFSSTASTQACPARVSPSRPSGSASERRSLRLGPRGQLCSARASQQLPEFGG
eukprot:1586256-Rhodomonas_salina.1